MKGVLLAGGSGSRLLPLTKVTNKHLLPVYNKPMIYYPLETLKAMGLTDILIVSGVEHSGHILSLLGSGREHGVRLYYEIQDEAGGIAQALGLAEDFADGEAVAVILGDNIFGDSFDVSDFKAGARIFLKEVDAAGRFGVAEVDGKKVLGIEEKPDEPKSNFAVTGLYVYENSVFDVIKTLKPSDRGELEITDVNNEFIGKGVMDSHVVDGFWTDAGTFESLHTANRLVRDNCVESSEQQ